MTRHNEPPRNSLAWLLFTALLIIAFAAAAWAGDLDVDMRQSNDMNTATTGDVNMGTGDALGVAFSFGDVDIGDCVVTKQTSILLVGWQRYEENPWCQAVVMYQMGQIDTAERILCRDTNIGTYYVDEVECRESIDLGLVKEVIATVSDDHLEEEEELHEEWLLEQQQLQQDYDERIALLEAKLNKPPKTVHRVEQRGLTEEQKQALLEVKE